MIDRRTLLLNSLKLSAGSVLGEFIPARADANVRLDVSLAKAGGIPLPEDFIGLGYEMSSVAPLGLLSAKNRRYVKLVKGLGSKGVIRVGGIVADYTRYDANGTIKADKQDTVITKASLDQFKGFLDEVGWTAIWSVNFAQGSISDAVEEAKAVSAVLGESLLAMEIGNEVENYGRGRRPFRNPSYSYSDFREEYSKWHAAITAAVPNIRFAAPDTASSIEWVEKLAADANGDVQLLTTHYYRGNQGSGSADQLIAPDPRLTDRLSRMRTISERSRIPWRLCETNSFSGGGRPGVSDSFLGALWTLDFLLQFAANGCSGVNIETGVNQLGFVSSYSPIPVDENGVASAGVPYYGMLAFAYARRGCTQVIPIELPDHNIHMSVYALGTNGKPRSVIAVNRDSDHDAEISLAALNMNKARLLRLSAPSMASTSGVSFGDEVVNSDGEWHARHSELIRGNTAFVPHSSAVVILVS